MVANFTLGNPERFDNKIFKSLNPPHVPFAFYTKKEELMIPMQICLGPNMDTHIYTKDSKNGTWCLLA